MSALLGAGVDKNRATQYGTTPLFIAVQKANTDVVKSLIKRSQKGNINLDMEICTKKGLTPLLEAIKHGHFEECKLLIGARADVNNPSEITQNSLRLSAGRTFGPPANQVPNTF